MTKQAEYNKRWREKNPEKYKAQKLRERQKNNLWLTGVATSLTPKAPVYKPKKLYAEWVRSRRQSIKDYESNFS